jgi:thiopurine S-methyltransferase
MKQTIDWARYWSENRLGFHEGQVNQYLQRYLRQFDCNPGDRIFMPLCGKAVDILWLSKQGFHVVGVEISEIAVEAFFSESGLEYTLQREAAFKVYRAANITLYCGDFMDLEPQHSVDCKLVYDRASIVAIEPFNRASYVEQLLGIIDAGIPMLTIVLDYDQSKLAGPPFALSVAELKALYESRYQVIELEVSEQIDERERWREAGLTSLREIALKLESLK